MSLGLFYCWYTRLRRFPVVCIEVVRPTRLQIAPEVFQMKGYGKECDWWSLGAIFFECLIGYAPFASEDPTETYQKIIEWPKYLYFPEDVYISREGEDLIRGCVSSLERLPIRTDHAQQHDGLGR